MPTLKDARNQVLEGFIAEHEADPDGNLEKLGVLIKCPNLGSEKATRQVSHQESCNDLSGT